MDTQNIDIDKNIGKKAPIEIIPIEDIPLEEILYVEDITPEDFMKGTPCYLSYITEQLTNFRQS